eukprot:COSAG01_NODE_178_length_22933_cov_18.398529_23_plen_96_part_01
MGKTGGAGTGDRTRGTGDKERGGGGAGGQGGRHVRGPPAGQSLTVVHSWMIPAGRSTSDVSAPISAVMGPLHHETWRAEQPRAVRGGTGAWGRASI